MFDDFDPVLAQARQGSPDAFQAHYRDLVRPVAAYVRNKGVCEVDDVTSDVFLAVFTGLETPEAPRRPSWTRSTHWAARGSDCCWTA